jgi:polar amino acid transport system permease protein
MMIRALNFDSIVYLVFAARWTLALAAIAFVGGAIGGVLVAIGATVRFTPLRWLVKAFIQIIEGIPLLMLLFMSYFGMALFGLRIDPWISVTIALCFYASAFLGEIWAGCIRNVPKGQWQAAQSLALSNYLALRLVILPQAVRIAVPPTVGFLVQLIKGTALASIVGFYELTRAGQMLNNLTFKPFIIYLVVAVCYFCMCFPLSLLSRWLEVKLAAPYRK